ncbi:hypothetical protein AVEN_250949-1 [Araneus ventricosus]|uniref:PiggyBac transposable element-derived protein domain-containing protein n=1 Tax=Araneus ventricosus TaxID=182803 RepID=A0A4Y2P169_ARAVE|nr:hypothetical protein AVEN_250949-1 [Araneus ventricosus]
MDLPSDSEVDLYDSHIDPDYSPIQKNENSSRSLSDDNEQIIGEPTVTTETDSKDAGSDKENFNHVTKAVKNKKSVKSDMHWCVNKDNDFSKEPPVFEPKKNSDFIGETPLEYLYRLIPESYLEQMCFQSNLYTTQHGKENLNISMGERKVFIGTIRSNRMLGATEKPKDAKSLPKEGRGRTITAAPRPCRLSREEIVQLLQDLSESESDVEERSIDFDINYKPPQNAESKTNSSDSEESMDELSSGKNIQSVGVSAANISSSVLAPSI